MMCDLSTNYSVNVISFRLLRFFRCLRIAARFNNCGNAIGSVIETSLVNRIQPSLILKCVERKIKCLKIYSEEICEWISLIHGQGHSTYQINDKHNVIAEASQTMGGRHRYDECEDVIDECVERFVHERSPRKCGHRLQFIVDEQLRQHEQKAECIDTVHQRIYGPRIPTENENQIYFELDSTILDRALTSCADSIAANKRLRQGIVDTVGSSNSACPRDRFPLSIPQLYSQSCSLRPKVLCAKRSTDQVSGFSCISTTAKNELNFSFTMNGAVSANKTTLTSMIAPMPAGTSTKYDVCSSIKYEKMTIWLNARHSVVRTDSPAYVLLPRQNEMSFLNDKKSNRMWTPPMNMVPQSKYKLVSEKMPFTSSTSFLVNPNLLSDMSACSTCNIRRNLPMPIGA